MQEILQTQQRIRGLTKDLINKIEKVDHKSVKDFNVIHDLLPPFEITFLYSMRGTPFDSLRFDRRYSSVILILFLATHPRRRRDQSEFDGGASRPRHSDAIRTSSMPK